MIDVGRTEVQRLRALWDVVMDGNGLSVHVSSLILFSISHEHANHNHCTMVEPDPVDKH